LTSINYPQIEGKFTANTYWKTLDWGKKGGGNTERAIKNGFGAIPHFLEIANVGPSESISTNRPNRLKTLKCFAKHFKCGDGNGGGNGVGSVDGDDDATVTVTATATAITINNKGSERNGGGCHGSGGGRNGGDGGGNFGGSGGSHGQFLQPPSLPSLCRRQHHFRRRHLDTMVKVPPV
jgi:hypothetical protein